MNRRGFLQSVAALAFAPAIVRADSLMRVVPVLSLQPITFWSPQIESAGGGLFTLSAFVKRGAHWERISKFAKPPPGETHPTLALSAERGLYVERGEEWSVSVPDQNIEGLHYVEPSGGLVIVHPGEQTFTNGPTVKRRFTLGPDGAGFFGLGSMVLSSTGGRRGYPLTHNLRPA